MNNIGFFTPYIGVDGRYFPLSKGHYISMDACGGLREVFQ